MSFIPPEIKALIVAEIWRSDRRGGTLSALSLVWRDIVPFVREHRFKSLRFYSVQALASFIALSDDVPEIPASIRTLKIPFGSRDIKSLIHLMSSAVNVENFTLNNFNMDCNFSAALLPCTRLTILSLSDVYFNSLSEFSNFLCSIPNLSTLDIRCFDIEDLFGIAKALWPLSSLPLACRPWDTDGFQAAKPVPNLSRLAMELSTPADILFLDLLSSPKTLFPNLQEIKLRDHFIQSYRPHRLPALLERYRSSLRVLELSNGVDRETPLLVFPAVMEHFKFPVWVTTPLETLCGTLSSNYGTLKVVTVRLESVEIGLPQNIGRLDEVLAAMALERLNVETATYGSRREILERYFPRCSKRYGQLGLKGYNFSEGPHTSKIL